MTIFYHPRFRESFKNLPSEARMKAERKKTIFEFDGEDVIFLYIGDHDIYK